MAINEISYFPNQSFFDDSNIDRPVAKEIIIDVQSDKLASPRSAQRRLKAKAMAFKKAEIQPLQNRAQLYQNDRALLVKAQTDHNLNIVELLLEYGNNPKGWPAICYAAYLGHENVVRVLVDYGADVKSRCNEGSVLDFAIDRKNISLIQFLLDKGVFLESSFFYRSHQNVWREGMAFYFDKGKQISAADLGGLVYKDIRAGVSFDNIKLLVEQGADLTAYQNGIIYGAVHRADLDFIKYMISKGAPINFIGAQPNHVEKAEQNPFVMAVAIGRTDILNCLFDSGGLLPAGGDGYIWYHLFRHNNLDLTRLIVSKGLKIDISFSEYNPVLGRHETFFVLERAIASKNIDLVTFLLEKGVNVNQRFVSGKSPLKLAVEGGNRIILDLLIKYGARIEDV